VGHEGLETGLSGLGWALAGQPYAYPHEIDRRGCYDVLEMRFRRTSIAGTSGAKRTHGLGDGPFNASALGILGFIRVGLLPLSGCLQAEILFLRSHGDRPPLRTRTIDSTGACLATTL
jgi:hypothetical protein